MRTKHLLTKMMLLVAVMLTGAGTAWADSVTFTAGTDTSEGTSITKEGITVSFSDGVFNRTDNYRCYSGASMTISSTVGNITQIDFTATSSNPMTKFSGNPDVGAWTNTSTKTQWKGDASEINFGKTSGQARITEIVVTYTAASTATLTSIALSGDYPTSFFVGDAFSTEGMTVTATYEDNSTKDVTSKATFFGYDMATTGSQEVTVSYTEGEVTKTATYNITVNAIPTHNVTWSVNGTITTESYKEGAAITFPENPADVEGKTFVGWTASAITGVIDEAPTFVTSATMGTEALTFYAVFAEKTPGTLTTVTDKLTTSTFGSPTTYTDWSGKSSADGSDAVYAGNSTTSSSSNGINAGAIQLRAKDNSGIVSTTSGGTLKSVTVTWTGSDARTLDVYGSNKAYTAASDLYDNNKKGKLLGSIVKGTSTSLTVSGDYAYVGLRSNANTLYLDYISIEWTTGTPDTYSAYCTTVAADTREEAGISFAEAAVTAEIVDNYTGQALSNPNSVSPITWTSSNEAVATVEDGTVTVLAVGVTTITAKFDGNDDYKKATVSYTLTVQDSRQAIDLSFAEASVTVNITETVAAPTLNGNTGNGAVTYESSNTDIATVDATGVVTGVAVGTATITATVAATNQYFGGTATFTVKVIDPNANDGSSVEKAFTVAEAIAATPTSGTSANFYIKGIVSAFKATDIVSDGSNYRYYISDDGTTTNQLLVYKGKGLNNVAFSSADDLQIGDEVVILGGLTMYSNAPEVAQNNYIVSLTRNTASISLSANTIDATADETEGVIEVTYNNFTVAYVDVVFYESDGTTTTTCDWIVTNFNASNNLEYVIGANTGAARTAYMKVYALDAEANELYSKLITVTQAKYVAPDVPVDPAVAGVGCFVKVTSTADITAGNYLIVYEGDKTHDAVAFNGALTDLDVTNSGISVAIVDGKILATDATVAATFTLQPSGSLKSASGYYIGRAAYSNGLDVEESALTNTFEIDANGNAVITAEGGCTLRYNYASDNLRFRYYKSGQQAVQLYKYDATATSNATATITAAGYATYCSPAALDYTNVDGLTAYRATISSDKKVSFTKVEKVPAGEGVLLKGNEGIYTIPVIASAEVIENDFIGVTKETKVTDTGIFVLMAGDETNQGTGFYQTTKAFTVKANSAYLPALAGDASRTFIGLDDVTSVKGITAETMANGEVYNLQGQRVSSQFTVHNSQLKKGLYIMNGKKVLVK